MKILVTGCAGFIGSNLCDSLLGLGVEVVGIDNFNDYYNPKIKENNLKYAKNFKTFKLYKVDILDFDKLYKIFKEEQFEVVVHLAARAGVRPSLVDPVLYAQVNVLGTINLLKLSSEFGIAKFIFGSSSSVYGNSPIIPFSEEDVCLNIISPYGASKKIAEQWVRSFNKNFGLKSLVLRFFTVYGPRGRVDMAPYLFTNAIINGKELIQFGDGSSSRDYTFVADIVEGIIKSLDSNWDFEIVNLGNNNPVKLTNFIKIIENETGKKAKIKSFPKQIGDVERTWANVSKAKSLFRWQPKTKLSEGIKIYVSWINERNKSQIKQI